MSAQFEREAPVHRARVSPGRQRCHPRRLRLARPEVFGFRRSSKVSGGSQESEAPASGDSGVEGPQATPDAAVEESHLTESQRIFRDDVRSPVGVPREYKHSDASLHQMFRVDLELFAGPLDLLVYLIRRHDLDVFDIPIAFLAERYLEMLERLKALEIDVAAEFLVFAADLLHIKSKMLLPARVGDPVEDEEEEEEGDPREDLVRRLLEYQKYRNAAESLGDRYRLGRDVFARTPSDASGEGSLDPGLRSVSIFRLVEVMARLLKKQEQHHQISFESFSIIERIQRVLGFGDVRGGRFELLDLFAAVASRSELVVTFIAVLESTKLGLLRLFFDEPPEPPRKWAPAPWSPSEDPPQEGLASEEDTADLRAELEELEAELALEPSPAVAPESGSETPPSKPWIDEPLPVIWVELTGKKFDGELLDDYRT